MEKSFLIVAAALPLMTACGLLPEGEKKDPLSGLKAYNKAGGSVAGAGFTGPAQARVSVGSAAGITPDKDIVWAPENPDEAIGGNLEEIWKKPENKSWNTDYPETMRYARQSGKPILLWFTHTARSPLCRSLSAELFSTGEFEKWAKENVARCRVDAHITASGELGDSETRQKQRIDYLKKRYKVMGFPTVVMLSPNGNVLASYRGYKKGGNDFYWGRLKQVTRNAKRDYGAWRERQEAKGYRLWTSRGGRKIFAKLYRFRNGKVTLVDPDGKLGTTSYSGLCDADQQWITAEKKKYDAARVRR